MSRLSSAICVLMLISAAHIGAENVAERYERLNKQAQKLMFDDKQQAMEILAEAKQLIPGMPLAYVNTGTVLLVNREDRTEIVQREFQHALSLCRTRRQLKSIMGLMEIPSQAFYKDGTSELYKQGRELISAGKCREAIPVLRKAVKINPRIALTAYELGYAFVDIGEIDSAIVHLEHGRKLNPAKYGILKELAFCYSDKSNIEALRQVVAEIEFLHGEDPYIKRELALAYDEAGMCDMALAVLGEALEKFPEYHLCAYSMGRILIEKKNDPQSARPYLQRFIDNVEGKSQQELGFKLPAATVQGMLGYARKLIVAIDSAGSAEAK